MQGEDVHFTVKSNFNQYVTYKIQPSGQAEIVNMVSCAKVLLVKRLDL